MHNFNVKSTYFCYFDIILNYINLVIVKLKNILYTSASANSNVTHHIVIYLFPSKNRVSNTKNTQKHMDTFLMSIDNGKIL